MKATLARSVKFSAQKADVKGNELGYQSLVGALLDLEKNADPSVKLHALVGLNSIVSKNLEIMKGDVKSKRLENFIYKETAQRKELLEIVDLGPFK